MFDEVAREYPDIENEHWIVDIGAAKLADTPEAFDVVVLPNLYGDILSDVAAQIAGSVGLAPSANIGEQMAMFEAIHGSAPRRAGQDVANPSGLLLAGVMMLVHIGQPEVAQAVHNAWLKAIEDGIHTYDIYEDGQSTERVGTAAFAQAVIDRLGMAPTTLRPVAYAAGGGSMRVPTASPTKVAHKETVGVDVFVHHRGTADDLAARLAAAVGSGAGLDLLMITNRGLKVWPDGRPETFCTDHWRCRFQASRDGKEPTSHAVIAALLQRLAEAGIDFIKTEHLCTFDGEPGYSMGQGQ